MARPAAHVHADHGALGAERAGDLSHELGPGDGGRVDADLVGAETQQPAGILERADAAADGQRDEHLLRRARHHVQHRLAAFGGGGDVVEDDLVGALGVVAGRQLDGVAGIAQPGEPHALDDPAGVDVKARDDPHRSHTLAQPASYGRPATATRVGHPEAALVDGPPDYGPGQAPAARLQPGQPAQVVQRPHAARRDQRHLALCSAGTGSRPGRGRA